MNYLGELLASWTCEDCGHAETAHRRDVNNEDADYFCRHCNCVIKNEVV